MNIAELRKTPHLSASAINDYLDCGLSYKFGRVDGIKSESHSASLLVGSCIHKALEDFHLARQQNHRKTEDFLHERFDYHWKEELESDRNYRFNEDESPDDLITLSKQLLTVYFKNFSFKDYRVLNVEMPFSFEIEGVDIPIIGIIDLVEVDSSGLVIITDFKTASKAYSKADIDSSLQLTLYYMAARRCGFDANEILLKFDCMIKTKTPKFAQYYTVRTEQDENRMVKKVQEVWKAIQNNTFVPHDGTWKCGYCSFRNHCDRWFSGL